MLSNPERLALLERRFKRAEAYLEALKASQSLEASKLQADYLAALQEAEEALAAAETLLLMELERLAMLRQVQSAFPATTSEHAATTALIHLTRSANKF